MKMKKIYSTRFKSVKGLKRKGGIRMNKKTMIGMMLATLIYGSTPGLSG